MKASITTENIKIEIELLGDPFNYPDLAELLGTLEYCIKGLGYNYSGILSIAEDEI